MKSLVTYMDGCYTAGVAPDAPYIAAFTNLSRRIADLVGANAAIAIAIDHGQDDEASQNLRDHQLDMARELNRSYELTDRIRGSDGIGSGLTREERDRELANLMAAFPQVTTSPPTSRRPWPRISALTPHPTIPTSMTPSRSSLTTGSVMTTGITEMNSWRSHATRGVTAEHDAVSA